MSRNGLIVAIFGALPLDHFKHPKVVQELLGHSTITLTLDTYSHVVPVMHAEVASHMDALFPRAAES